MWFDHKSDLSDSVSKVHIVLATCLLHVLDYPMHCVKFIHITGTDPTIETYHRSILENIHAPSQPRKKKKKKKKRFLKR